jgi:hypothetical protein
MKLVRLESNSTLTQSQFTNNLSIPLVLGKNAQVALKCLTLQFAQPPLIIDSTNNKIRYFTDALSGAKEITIPSGQYEIGPLMDIIQLLMNSMIQSEVSNSSDDGFEWLVNATGNGQIGFTTHIAFNRTDTELVTSATCDFIDDSMQYVEPNFIKNVADNGTYNAGLLTDKPLNGGCWKLSMTVDKQSGTQTEDIADSKWIFGVAEFFSQFEEGETNLLEQMYVCVSSNDGQYLYKKNDVMVETNIAIQAEDIITISKRQKSETQTVVLYTITKDSIPTYFEGDIIQTSTVRALGGPAYYTMLKIGDDTGKIAFNTIEYNPTPSVTQTAGIFTRTKASDVPFVIRNEAIPLVQTDVIVDLLSDELKLLLGYNKRVLEQLALSFDFVSESGIATNIFNNDIVVEIPELALDGYDEGVKQSRNIAMVISSGELRTSQKAIGNETYELTYSEQATFLFIGLKNKQTSVTCPQLTVRVTSEGQILPLSGKMTALLLFRDEDDKMF